ncbi:MAG: zf-HC2 domain-containing protein [Propionicimonas sp.]|uniref:zf-HC2 domain-containing protein n=1 Tax=Propionicimonas sp. TaxID=1955623 RepID=UPI003D0C66C9
MTDWHPDPDQLVALALADVAPDDEQRLVAHLAGCPACRDAYAEVSDGVQQALAATPAVAPPAGFSGRVLAGMVTDEPALRPRRRTPLLLVAAVLLGLLAGVGGTLAATAWFSRPPAAAGRAPVAASLVTDAGDAVGSVGLATLSGRTYVLLNVTSGKPDVRYECILVGADGTRTSGGAWALNDEYGTGTASGSWLVPLAGDPPVSVELVGPSGGVWARASL